MWAEEFWTPSVEGLRVGVGYDKCWDPVRVIFIPPWNSSKELRYLGTQPNPPPPIQGGIHIFDVVCCSNFCFQIFWRLRFLVSLVIFPRCSKWRNWTDETSVWLDIAAGHGGFFGEATWTGRRRTPQKSNLAALIFMFHMSFEGWSIV